MDVAADHIQEEALSPDSDGPSEENGGRPRAASGDLGTEFKEAYQAFSSSAWGTRLGGFFGQVRKQGESYYQGARQELTEVSAEANKGLTDLMSRAQALSLGQTTSATATDTAGTEDSESGQKDIVKEAENLIAKLRVDAAARLKQIQKAEDAADEALERLGMNIRSFLRDAVTIAPPGEGDRATHEVLFESKDSDGKRVVHATRFDAQMHVIHSRLPSFTQDPESDEFKPWKETFDVEQKTDTIAKDLERYDELRRAMDKLVPEQVSYADFWTRYYFLRHVIETEEQKRRELLKETQTQEEVAWDDEDEEEEPRAETTKSKSSAGTPNVEAETDAEGSTITLHETPRETDLLKPNEGRRSNEHSVADSDASYDLVSGAPSQGPSTPKDERDAKNLRAVREQQSDDEDWE